MEPATENYKVFNNEADDLLQVLDLSEREYGLVADFGNAAGPRKYDTLSKLMPRATAIHQWVEIDCRWRAKSRRLPALPEYGARQRL